MKRHSIYILIVSILYSCQSTTNQTMKNHDDQDSISCTKLIYTFLLAGEKETNYRIETINKSGEIVDKEIPMPNFIKELYKQSQEKDKTIYFDGKKSLTEQVDDDYCFWSKTTTIRDTSAWITIHKPLKYVHFWDRYQEASPAREEKSDDPAFTFTKKTKQILDYLCEQVIVESSSNKKICWFTKQLQLKDPTKTLIRFDSIPGTILEMEEYWLNFNHEQYVWQHVKTIQVKSIEQVKVHAHFFEVPKGVQKMDSEQAQKLNTKLMQEANKELKQLNQEEKSKFLGTWILKEDGFGFQIEINDLGNNSYAFIQTDIEAGKLTLTKTEKAAFYGSYLVLNECMLYKVTADGKLQEEQNPFYTFAKSEDENQILLNSLNYWVKGGGDPEHRNKNMKSTGESNSRVEDLKQKVTKKGLKIKWVNGKYEFEK